jgi:hypothetical protein
MRKGRKYGNVIKNKGDPPTDGPPLPGSNSLSVLWSQSLLVTDLKRVKKGAGSIYRTPECSN